LSDLERHLLATNMAKSILMSGILGRQPDDAA
jgi:hypothetical protein